MKDRNIFSTKIQYLFLLQLITDNIFMYFNNKFE